ncbi:GNAT family N-acetyltransferase [Bacillus sp. HMF5848]|uniref:GNAT family N-acetyltransferase n=1 Tax=Bacillus sp. HMF5848 TaxID=2495421 RepID=UPI000F789B13|nr:GNAT family N-acetyltransferase [Bacillus sp. HMF5848]RSK27541.1 GNAT family N-acetyltransferase [Bacillus sp. HMF5848]
MSTDISLKKVNLEEFNENMLDYFHRYQEVKRVWRIENNKKVIKNISFIEDWDHNEKQIVIQQLKQTLLTGGTVFAAYEAGYRLIGFASLGSQRMGEKEEYLCLHELYVSEHVRGKGIGKLLFQMCVKEAKSLQVKKLYISAHSSVETIDFYVRMGCVDATWIWQQQVHHEPYDCQLEYVIN